MFIVSAENRRHNDLHPDGPDSSQRLSSEGRSLSKSRLSPGSNHFTPCAQSPTNLPPFDWSKAEDERVPSKECVRVNLSGVCFELLRRNLLKFPKTRLGRLALLSSVDEATQLCDNVLSSSKEFYFDRSPYSFDSIVNLYRQGVLHIPENTCATGFKEEMDYWLIDKSLLSDCCEYKLQEWEQFFFNKRRDGSASARKNLAATPGVSSFDMSDDQAESSFVRDSSTMPLSGGDRKSDGLTKCYGGHCSRACVWDLVENPKHSLLALMFNVISILFVIATMICLMLSSLPEFHDREERLAKSAISAAVHATVASVASNTSINESLLLDEVNNGPKYTGLEIADIVCVVFFTAEFMVRSWAAPDRAAYARTFMFWIDLFAVFPFYVELTMKETGYESKTFGDVRRSLLMIRILRALRVVRVLRVLKIARYSRGFQSVGATMKKSWKELLMLVLFILTTNIIFSTIMYFLESDVANSHFESIPASAWWCIITMTTVGYGDVFPITITGKVVAGIVSIVGIILLAFPISVIVENFHEEYSDDNSDGGTKNSTQKEDESEVETTLLTSNQTMMALKPHSAMLHQLMNGMMICELRAVASQSAENTTANQKPKKKRRHRRGFKL